MRSLNRRPTILVIGATGTHGGSVARHLLADGRWTVRAFTSNPESSAARTLRDVGAEIAMGDLDAPVRLRAALGGCDGVYGVARDLRDAHTIVQAATSARVRHLVLRTRADAHAVQVLAGESASAPAGFEAAVLQYARARGVPATVVRAAPHYEQLLTRFSVDTNGALTIDDASPDARVAAISSEDVGGIVAALFARRDEYVGRVVRALGDIRSWREYADALGRALDHSVASAPLARTGAPSRDGDEALAESRRLFRRLRTFEEWARQHAREVAPLLAAAVQPADAAAA